MTPNLKEKPSPIKSSDYEHENFDGNELILTPFTNSEAEDFSLDSDLSFENNIQDNNNLDQGYNGEAINVTLEHNLKEILLRTNDVEDLESITQVKLRVIAREVTLQHLEIYTPALRELVLDGSVISTLRDLGTNLRNLKILRVNRCCLTCIDSVFSFENLEELYAADNELVNVTPCAFLNNIKIIDVRRNRIKYMDSLTYLTLCPELVHLYLEGNNTFETHPLYRRSIKSIIPELSALDGKPFTIEECENLSHQEIDVIFERKKDNTNHINTMTNISEDILNNFTPRSRRQNVIRTTGFTVTFPPRVFIDRQSPSGTLPMLMRGDQFMEIHEELINKAEEEE